MSVCDTTFFVRAVTAERTKSMPHASDGTRDLALFDKAVTFQASFSKNFRSNLTIQVVVPYMYGEQCVKLDH